MTRIVRQPNGEITIDPTGKISGRGAYLCSNKECWFEALNQKRIERALKVVLTAEQCGAMATHASQLPDMSSEEA